MSGSVYFSFASYNSTITSSENIPVPQEEIGVFTTIKIREGIPLFLKNHLKRLTDSIKELNLLTTSLSPLEEDIKKVIKGNGEQIAAIRVTIYNGNVLIHERSLPQGYPAATITVTDTRSIQNKDHKVINRTFLNQASEQAHKAGAKDVLFTDEYGLCESTISNIFSINSQGQIITPPIKGRGLNGICRQLLMKKISVQEENIPINTDDPIVLINTLRVSKIISINGKKIADGENLLQQLQIALDQMEEEYLKKILT